MSPFDTLVLEQNRIFSLFPNEGASESPKTSIRSHYGFVRRVPKQVFVPSTGSSEGFPIRVRQKGAFSLGYVPNTDFLTYWERVRSLSDVLVPDVIVEPFGAFASLWHPRFWVRQKVVAPWTPKEALFGALGYHL